MGIYLLGKLYAQRTQGVKSLRGLDMKGMHKRSKHDSTELWTHSEWQGGVIDGLLGDATGLILYGH